MACMDSVESFECVDVKMHIKMLGECEGYSEGIWKWWWSALNICKVLHDHGECVFVCLRKNVSEKCENATSHAQDKRTLINGGRHMTLAATLVVTINLQEEKLTGHHYIVSFLRYLQITFLLIQTEPTFSFPWLSTGWHLRFSHLTMV